MFATVTPLFCVMLLLDWPLCMFLPFPSHTSLLQYLAHPAHSLLHVHMHPHMISVAVPLYQLTAKGQPHVM